MYFHLNREIEETSEKNAECGLLTIDSKLRPTNCKTQQHFICQRPIGKSIRLYFFHLIFSKNTAYRHCENVFFLFLNKL